MQSPDPAPSRLVQRLCARQTLLGWSDRRMAEELGVSASLWNHTRHRRIPVGITLLRAAGRRFPDLAGDILHDLLAHTAWVESAS
jgi:hypothetical protein